MDYQLRLERLNEALLALRPTWTKKDYEYLAGKGTTRGRLLGFMTRGYYQRNKLWETGIITYGYCYRTYTDNDLSRPYLAWLLFSPSSVFEQEPERYERILERLTPIIEEQHEKGPHRQLMQALTSPLTEAKYFQIPDTYTEGKLVYVSTVYVFPDMHDSITIGVIPIIIAPNVTQEIMLVPEAFLTSQIDHSQE